MKFSRRCDAKFKPSFHVEDLKGIQIYPVDFMSFGEALEKARELSCYTRGGCRVGVCMASFKIVGGRIESEV